MDIWLERFGMKKAVVGRTSRRGAVDMVLVERVLSALPAPANAAGATLSNFSSSEFCCSWAFLRCLKQKKIKEQMAATARRMPIAIPALAPPDMPPSATGTLLALVVGVEMESGVVLRVVSDARRTDSLGFTDLVGTIDDGRSDEGSDDCVDFEGCGGVVEAVAAACVLGLGFGGVLLLAGASGVLLGVGSPWPEVEYPPTLSVKVGANV